jgi:hypothetical protein
MNVKTSWSWPRAATVIGLLVGALGISVLWWSRVAFPIYPPPGIIILLAGTLFVGLAPWRWAPGIGAFLGLFVIVGFVISPTGIPYLLGQHGPVCANRHLDRDYWRANRADRRFERNPSELPEAGSVPAMNPLQSGEFGVRRITALNHRIEHPPKGVLNEHINH